MLEALGWDEGWEAAREAANDPDGTPVGGFTMNALGHANDSAANHLR